MTPKTKPERQSGIRDEFEKAYKETFPTEQISEDDFDKGYYWDVDKVALWAAKWMAETIELIILSELGHTKNNSQRAYTWHEIEDLLMEIMKLAKELSDGK